MCFLNGHFIGTGPKCLTTTLLETDLRTGDAASGKGRHLGYVCVCTMRERLVRVRDLASFI